MSGLNLVVLDHDTARQQGEKEKERKRNRTETQNGDREEGTGCPLRVLNEPIEIQRFGSQISYENVPKVSEISGPVCCGRTNSPKRLTPHFPP